VGFTLIELLVVISIITLLISILLPTLTKARETVRAVRCLSNVRQIAMGTINYAYDHKDFLPSFNLDLSSVPARNYDAYVNLVDDGGYLPAKFDSDLYRRLGFVSLDSDVWHCPSVGVDEYMFSGGYGVSELKVIQIYDSNNTAAYPGGLRLDETKQPSKLSFLADARGLVDGKWVTWTAYWPHPSENWDAPIAYGQQAAPRHHGGSYANAAFLDSHAASVLWEDFRDNVDNIFDAGLN